MFPSLSRVLRAVPLAPLLAAALSPTPAQAQDVLRDAETEAFLRDLAAPLVKAAKLNPGNVQFIVLNDPEINAFSAGGQTIYVNSGLINAADHAEEVQGVLAHELGHITGEHAIDTRGEVSAGRISILSLLLAGAAMAAGGGDAAMGILAAGQQAALGHFIAYTREEEAQADAAGAQFLSTAGISGRGSLEFFHKLLNLENRYGLTRTADDAFYNDHPMTDDRIQTLADTYAHDPAWNHPADEAQEARFRRIKAKLFGYLAEPNDTMQAYPTYMTGVPARYARAYAWHKQGYLDKAMAESDALLADDPNDPYFLELKGQMLLEAGHPDQALAPLRRATDLTGNQPLIATTFGHALIAADEADGAALTPGSTHFAEATRVLKAAVARDRENPEAWYELGTVYAANGDTARAQLASAEMQVLEGRMADAMRSASAARAGLPAGSPDALRAGDIILQAQSALARAKHPH